MNPTGQTLLEQMRITDFEIASRQELLEFAGVDLTALSSCRELIGERVDEIVKAFYEQQTNNPEIARLIGDAETLGRLAAAQRQYVLDLFSGDYDREYVNNRLRIGLVHKRIGVEPKLYLAAVHLLRSLIIQVIRRHVSNETSIHKIERALDKLIYFDVTLVFETYIQSMLSEIEDARNKTEKYAKALEETVQVRTGQLRIDQLTGLTTRSHFDDAVQRMLRAAERRREPVTVAFLDIDDFKTVNDELGHASGDKVLTTVGKILLKAARSEDVCARYGGDEFCVALSNCTKEQARGFFCKRIEELMAERMPEISLSVGLAETGRAQYVSVSELIAHADDMMYKEKAVYRAQGGQRQRESESQSNTSLDTTEREHPKNIRIIRGADK